MKFLQTAFNYHQLQLAGLLSEATGQPNPGIWLTRNGLRHSVIQLEGLTRICCEIYSDDIFKKWNDQYRNLQVKLGDVQHYCSVEYELSGMPLIPVSVKEELKELVFLKSGVLDLILIADGWLYDNQNGQMNEKLEQIDWRSDSEIVEQLESFYLKQLSDFGEQDDFQFTSCNGDLRELRQKLRWLCIYPHATLGLFAYSPFSQTRNLTRMKKYMADKIEQSKYAELPTYLQPEHPIFLDKYSFLSLNWIVDKLGQFYYTGLKEIVLREAMKDAAISPDESRPDDSYKLLGDSQPRMDILLSVASTVASLYFKEKNFKSLFL